MNSSGRAPQRYRSLWVSDVHLGSRGCKARQLTSFLRAHDCEQLYLVGDIFDGWKLKSHFYWAPEHSSVIRAVISKARKGTEVYYIAGNHDDFMRQFVRRMLRLGRIRLANEVVHVTVDGRRLLVVHGDCFDEVVYGSPLLAHAGDVGYELLMRADAWINRWRTQRGLPALPISAGTKTRVKAAVQYLSGFDEKILHRCRREKLNGVICGHTHHAEARYVRDGVMSYNCGDWVESCTALAEDFNGEIRVLHYSESMRKARPVAPAVRERFIKAAPAIAGNRPPRIGRRAPASVSRSTAALPGKRRQEFAQREQMGA